ncbi:class I SAM-dependent methyltransferase [Candidatus Mycobacterium methanotrophicum]|uniref:S-adenosyl-L-methionine-dependent methyltransferase n=1 Tax=Candidatus Mycobacterium methanotrophicum TaxID=2943498 RepID=A0ABY4QN89_9MYCO|nr:class I SAM-dependent methyltransferase [Candidatus Mycobacterium methanotrophicum]UQX12094.1 class I SAM-dependent methyltransferase [Candidatus Mycobacterium methanotrophicum]
MPRTDNDSWEITESVGATALGVAAARMADTESDNPLIHDPFARVFLEAAGEGMWNWFASGDLPPEVIEAEPDVPLRMQGMRDYMASRTMFFDQFVLDAANAGVQQVVILAAGLDARSWRLPWPAGVTVYELDQPKVLEFKSSTLQERGAQPTAKLVNVPVDLRHDWPTALRQAGFDPDAPSVFTAEGLLPFLPSAAQDLLFERIQALTAPGSRAAAEVPGPEFNNPDFRDRQRAQMQRYRELAARLGHGEHDFPDFEELWYFEDRTDVGDWLREHGWDVSVLTTVEMMARYDRRPPEGIEDGSPDTLFVWALRS